MCHLQMGYWVYLLSYLVSCGAGLLRSMFGPISVLNLMASTYKLSPGMPISIITLNDSFCSYLMP